MYEVRKFRLRKFRGLFVRHAWVVILDLEESINLLERQPRSFDEEIPDEG
jgi:hypothetical protein